MLQQEQQTKKIQYHWEIDTYKLSVQAAMEIYELSKAFPEEEKKRKRENGKTGKRDSE